MVSKLKSKNLKNEKKGFRTRFKAGLLAMAFTGAVFASPIYLESTPVIRQKTRPVQREQKTEQFPEEKAIEERPYLLLERRRKRKNK